MTSIEFWSSFIFWLVSISIIVTLLLTVVVIIGGIFDIKFLITELKKIPFDELDGTGIVTKNNEE